jgi:glycosyltransferase involved in cell wall biosynthesis
VIEAELLVLSGWTARYDTLLARRRGPTILRWHSALLQTELSDETWKLARIVELLDAGRILAVAANDPAVVLALRRDDVLWFPDVLDRREYAGVEAAALTGTNVSLFSDAHHRKNLLCQSAAFEAARRAAGDADWTLHLNGQSQRLPEFARWLERSGVRFVEHGYLVRGDYLALAAGMDAGLAATLSESYGYVAADHLELGVPVVVSSAVPCADAGELSVGNVSDVAELADRLTLALASPDHVEAGRESLRARARLNLERAEAALTSLRERAAGSGWPQFDESQQG